MLRLHRLERKAKGIHSTIINPVLSSLSAIPEDDVMSNNNIALIVTRRGGHIGFLEGLLPSPKTMMNKALVQFALGVFEKGVA